MRPNRREVITGLVLGNVITLWTSLYERVLPAYGIQTDACGPDVLCDELHSGWPFAFIRDNWVTSPRGNADVLGVVMGDNDMLWGPYLANVALFSVLAILVLWRSGRMRRP